MQVKATLILALLLVGAIDARPFLDSDTPISTDQDLASSVVTNDEGTSTPSIDGTATTYMSDEDEIMPKVLENSEEDQRTPSEELTLRGYGTANCTSNCTGTGTKPQNGTGNQNGRGRGRRPGNGGRVLFGYGPGTGNCTGNCTGNGSRPQNGTGNQFGRGKGPRPGKGGNGNGRNLLRKGTGDARCHSSDDCTDDGIPDHPQDGTGKQTGSGRGKGRNLLCEGRTLLANGDCVGDGVPDRVQDGSGKNTGRGRGKGRNLRGNGSGDGSCDGDCTGDGIPDRRQDGTGTGTGKGKGKGKGRGKGRSL